ncbi:MAG TPA: preprotein translocase subunit YajC [Oleiagrimonas sp.]|nr:preprotein translocase subunit YajC [Oleiagrimonas sp.]HET7300206.1 preprotein translocase subunit YajC [Oleiagrimonas sp.]
MSILNAVAAGAAAPAAGGQAAGGASMLIIIVVMFVAMYFMLIRPQQKRQKQHRAMVEALAKGDEVITNGGVAGRIDALGDSFVTVEIADGVKIKLQRAAISQVLPKGTLKSA